MFRNRIKERLAELGWNEVLPKDELLKSLGITKQMWNKWVNNRAGEMQQPNARQLMILKEYLLVDHIDDLVEVTKKKPQKAIAR